MNVRILSVISPDWARREQASKVHFHFNSDFLKHKYSNQYFYYFKNIYYFYHLNEYWVIS